MATESLAELVRFAPDVYGFRYVNHVATFIVTSAGVILVDPIGQVNRQTPALIKEAIRSVTAEPVRYVIYSHSAFDHSTGAKQDVVEQRRYHADLRDAIATARAAGLADASPEMTTLVRSILHPKYGAWRRFDEFLALNIQGMIAWRAGKSPSAH